MSQSGYTPILIYASGTATNVPLAANLTSGASGAELALNYADGKLYYKDSGGVVQVLATKGTGPIGGSNTQVQYNSSGALAGSANLTFDGTTLTANALTVSNAVTLSAGTANGVLYLNGSKVATSGSALTFDGTTFQYTGAANFATSTGSVGIGTSSPAYKLDVRGGVIAGGNGTIVGGISYSTRPEIGAISNHPCGFITNNTTQMLLDTSGNLGIGTSSPNQKLDVAGSLQIRSSGTSYLNNSDNTNQYYWQNIGATGANNATLILSRTNAGETLRVDSSGNLGLGVTPSAWYSTRKVVQAGNASMAGIAGSDGYEFRSNAYLNTSGSEVYLNNGNAALYASFSGQHRWYTAASGTAGNAITFTQAMTLDASGNLAVGTTTTTSARLRVDGGNGIFIAGNGASGYNVLQAQNDVSTGISVGVSGSTALGWSQALAHIGTTSNSPLVFGTNSTERARIDTSGNFLVGTTDSSASAGTGVKVYPTGFVSIVAPSTLADTFDYYNSTAGAYRFYVTNAGVINATSTTITAISDQRLKENIQDLDVGLDKIMALKPRKFDWKPGKGKDIKGDRGWIAQEFEQVFPDMVSTWKDAPPEGEEPYKSVNADLIPVLVKAIQEQQAQIESLRKRLADAGIA